MFKVIKIKVGGNVNSDFEYQVASRSGEDQLHWLHLKSFLL